MGHFLSGICIVRGNVVVHFASLRLDSFHLEGKRSIHCPFLTLFLRRPSVRQPVLFFFFVRITIELSQKNSWLELFVRFLDFLFFVSIHSSIHAPVACWAHFVQTLFRLTAAVEGRKRAGPFVQDGRPADSWPRRRHFPRYLRNKKRLKTNNLINVVSVDFKFGSVDFLLRRIAFPHLFIYFIWKDILYGFDYGYRYYYDFFALLFLFFFWLLLHCRLGDWLFWLGSWVPFFLLLLYWF